MHLARKRFFHADSNILLLVAVLMSSVRICFVKAERAPERLRKHWALHGITLGEPVITAGIGEERIVNGEFVEPNEFPSYLTSDNPGGCGLSLIRRRWALTACHCVYFSTGDYAPVKPEHFKNVKAGQHNRLPNEEGVQISQGMKIIPHPDYNHTGLIWPDDLALIKLTVPFNLTKKIQLAELVTKDYDGLDCIWDVSFRIHCFDGITPANCSKVNGTIRKVDLPMMINDKCEEYLPYEDFVRSKSFCAGYEEGGKSPCWGDSGSPAFLVKDGKTIQVGLVSGGDECATPKMPAVFTRLSAYRDWIDETIRKEEELDPTPGGP